LPEEMKTSAKFLNFQQYHIETLLRRLGMGNNRQGRIVSHTIRNVPFGKKVELVYNLINELIVIKLLDNNKNISEHSYVNETQHSYGNCS